MKTTIEHLLAPRFKVIADYPGSEFQLGSIIEDGEYDQNEKVLFVTIPDLPYQEVWPNRAIFFEFENFPHLFRPLQWWEDRKEEEMPKYLKDGYGLYLEVKKWQVFRKELRFRNLYNNLDHSNNYQPCSEEEYLANVKL